MSKFANHNRSPLPIVKDLTLSPQGYFQNPEKPVQISASNTSVYVLTERGEIWRGDNMTWQLLPPIFKAEEKI